MKQITLEQQARVIEGWKAAHSIAGRDYVPVNSGLRRTASKRALLSALARAAAARGRSPSFFAKF
jgi:hypothetical protein